MLKQGQTYRHHSKNDKYYQIMVLERINEFRVDAVIVDAFSKVVYKAIFVDEYPDGTIDWGCTKRIPQPI